MSIVVLINFIAILLTPGIFLIQIVNTNMYLINFHSKNKIKMCFPKVEFLKFQSRYQLSLSIGTKSNKLHLHQHRRHNNGKEPDLKKKVLIIIIYIVQNFDLFFNKKLSYFFFK